MWADSSAWETWCYSICQLLDWIVKYFCSLKTSLTQVGTIMVLITPTGLNGPDQPHPWSLPCTPSPGPNIFSSFFFFKLCYNYAGFVFWLCFLLDPCCWMSFSLTFKFYLLLFLICPCEQTLDLLNPPALATDGSGSQHPALCSAAGLCPIGKDQPVLWSLLAHSTSGSSITLFTGYQEDWGKLLRLAQLFSICKLCF